MKRREFIKITALGAAVAGSGGYLVYAGDDKGVMVSSDKRKLPVIASVDVLVLGGSLAAVSAAAAADDAGGSVCLVSSRSYLGDDICGEYRYWLPGGSKPRTALLKKLFPKGSFSTPFHVKKTLDDELLKRRVPFLFNSYVADVLLDEKGNAAGVIIANRTGLQVVRANCIIDAGRYASAARLAGAKIKQFESGSFKTGLITVGDRPVEREGVSSAPLPGKITVGKKSYAAFEHGLSIEMKGNSNADIAAAEQRVRSLTWENAREDGGDDFFDLNRYAEFLKIEGQGSSNKLVNPDKPDFSCFMPKGIKGVYVLSACADISADSAGKVFGDHDACIRIGLAFGTRAAKTAGKAGGSVAGRKVRSGSSSSKCVFVNDFFRDASPHGELAGLNLGPDSLPVWGEYDVVVVGGGTGGAPAAIGAARKGAKTLVCEQQHGLGGISTLGMIGRYYHGYRNGFTSEVDKGVSAMHPVNPGKRLGDFPRELKMEWYRKEILKAGGEIWFDAVSCGAVMDGNTVKGVVVVTPYGKGIVLARTVIDSTGSADVAIAAGADFKYTDKDTVAVQGAGLYDTGPGIMYHNSDWTFIDDGDVFDMWRCFVTARRKYKNIYDVGKILKTRERRRVVGDIELNAMDFLNKRTHPDTISVHRSNYDTHGFTISPYFFISPPNRKSFDVDVPLRCLLPKGLNGIIVTGLGASCHRDAMPVIRMQPCVQNQGYAVGMASAMVVKSGKQIRNVDIKALQKELIKLGNLSEKVLTERDSFGVSKEEIEKTAAAIGRDFKGLEKLLWDTDKALPIIRKKFAESKDGNNRQVLAEVMGHLGCDDGIDELVKLAGTYTKWDPGWNYRGMGQFGASGSPLDSILIAMGRSGNSKAVPQVARLAKMLDEKSAFSHFRALALAAEGLKTKELAPVLAGMLRMPGIMGQAFTEIEQSLDRAPESKIDVSTRNKSLKELFLARGLYRCGDHEGLGAKVLKQYARDLRGHYARHALGILRG